MSSSSRRAGRAAAEQLAREKDACYRQRREQLRREAEEREARIRAEAYEREAERHDAAVPEC